MGNRFDYFFFAPLDLEYFKVELLRKSPSINIESLIPMYEDWFKDFYRKSLNFYEHQYCLHSREIWLGFCKHYGVPEYESPENLGLEVSWKDWTLNNGLDTHYEFKQNHIKGLSDIQQTLKKSNSVTGIFLVDKNIRRNIYKIWFERETATNPRVSEELRNLNYEKYLQSKHWRKIRALMLLINSAVCQAKDCKEMGESWYGSTTAEIDVHHLTYENLGSEKIEDLRLLCRRHHELVHQNLQNTGNPGIEFDVV